MSGFHLKGTQGQVEVYISGLPNGRYMQRSTYCTNHILAPLSLSLYSVLSALCVILRNPRWPPGAFGFCWFLALVVLGAMEASGVRTSQGPGGATRASQKKPGCHRPGAPGGQCCDGPGIAQDSSWLILTPPGCSWLLLAPSGSSWLFLAPWQLLIGPYKASHAPCI